VGREEKGREADGKVRGCGGARKVVCLGPTLALSVPGQA